jgi:cell division transport system permease protein
MTVAATATISVALAVAGAGYLVSANLAHIAAILESQVEVVGFLRRDLTTRQQRQLLETVRAIPGVQSAVLVSRSEALRRLQRTFASLASIDAALPSNPLPDSIEVRVDEAKHVRDVAEVLQRIEGIDEVAYGSLVVDRLVALTRAVRLAGIALVGLLAASAVLIIVNTIRLTIEARRQEIEIMTLVGATPGFIRGPFILEGALQGAAAALAAGIVIAAGYVALAGQAALSLPFLPVLPPPRVLPQTLALVGTLGIAVGIVGSTIGLRRHLVV